MPTPPPSVTLLLKMSPMSSHLQQCLLASGRWHGLGCATEALHGFLAQRFVTTIVVVAGLAGLGWWWH